MNEQQEQSHNEPDSISMHFTGRTDPYLRPLDTAAILRNLLWSEFELARMAGGWMPAIADYDVKTHLGRFAYIHTMNMKYLHARILELPGNFNPKSGPPQVIRQGYERISMAYDRISFLSSYKFLLGHLYANYSELMTRLDPITDAPTKDQIKKALIERDDILSWLNEQLRFRNEQAEDQLDRLNQWKSYVTRVWAAMNEGMEQAEVSLLWPESPVEAAAGPCPQVGVNDPRFIPHDAKKGHMYRNPDNSPVVDSVKQMLFVNAGEIIAAESLTYLYYSAHNMPLEFYCDLARHMWDEVRHSQMGTRRLQQLGYKLEDFRFGKPIKLKEGTDIKEFLDSYMELTNVGEACSFPYKRRAAESFWKFGDALSAIQSEFDVVDERKHVDYGNKWGTELYKQIYNSVITTKELNERGRMRRLIQTKYPNEEGYSDLVKNAHEFCGSITNLNAIPYDKY